MADQLVNYLRGRQEFNSIQKALQDQILEWSLQRNRADTFVVIHELENVSGEDFKKKLGMLITQFIPVAVHAEPRYTNVNEPTPAKAEARHERRNGREKGGRFNLLSPITEAISNSPRWTKILFIGVLAMVVLGLIAILITPLLFGSEENAPADTFPGAENLTSPDTLSGDLTGQDPFASGESFALGSEEFSAERPSSAEAGSIIAGREELRPRTPLLEEAVDVGSAPWRGDAQWLQYGLLFALLGTMLIDTVQKVRTSMDIASVVLAILAPIIVLFTVLIIVTGEFQLSQAIFDYTTPIFFLIVFLGIAWLVGKFDLSFPAIGLAMLALIYVTLSDKSFGALDEIVRFGENSVLYNLEGTRALISNRDWETAKFSVTIYGLLTAAGFMLFLNLLKVVLGDYHSPTSYIGIGLGIFGGAIIFSINRYLALPWALVLLLLGVVVSAAIDMDDYDEGLALAAVLGTILTLAFATPLPV